MMSTEDDNDISISCKSNVVSCRTEDDHSIHDVNGSGHTSKSNNSDNNNNNQDDSVSLLGSDTCKNNMKTEKVSNFSKSKC